MDIPLDEVVFFDAIISTPSTSAAVDADSTPTFAVYEESTDTDIGIGGNLTKRTSLTGNYRGTFTASAANGFEVGKWYSIIGSAVVGGVTGKAVLKNFRIVLAEAVVGEPKVDVGAWLGTAASTPATAGIPDINVKNINNVAAATPGAAGGLFIAGSNAATTIAGLTTGALSCSTITASGAVAFQSTLAVTGATTFTGVVTMTNGLAANITGNLVGTVSTLTTYTGNTPQTGDSYARIGAAGAGLTALGDTRIANLDAAVSTRLASASYTAPDNSTIAAIAGYVDTEVAAIYARIGAPAGASIAADIAAAKSDTAAIKLKTDNLPASPAAVGSQVILSATGLDLVVIETLAEAETAANLNARQALALLLATLAGESSGGAGTSPIFKTPAGTARTAHTLDGNGNRTAATWTPPT